MGEPATERREREATYADVLAAPEHVVAEIVDGELLLSARPAPPHANAAYGLAALLAPYRFGSMREGDPGGPGGWWLLFEPELHVLRRPDDRPTGRSGRTFEVLVPDLAGWRRERLPRLPEEAAFTLAPDWICEVVSPSTAGLDRIRKLAVYAREGVRHAWILDPLARSLEVYRLEGPSWVRVGGFLGNETARAEPFDAVPLDLSLLWLPEEPPAPDEPAPPEEPPAPEVP